MRGKIVTAFIFLTMMTGAVSAAPVLDYTGGKNAFPIKKGDILNIRRLEQGIEQMKRVSSSDVSMKLLPADNI